MDKYRIGLDVGTNSLGWSVLELDEKGECSTIVAAGSRIFSDGRADKTKATLAAQRREARSARRRRDRFKQRQTFLLAVLTEAGLFPADIQEREALRVLNPLELRARALSEKLEPYKIGRALFHLNQRRGFNSNRKDKSEETTSGKVSKSVRMLLEEMKLINPPMPAEEYKELSKEDKKQGRQEEAQARHNALEKLADQKDLSFGSFLYERHKKKKPTRARPGAGDDGKLYDVYPTRELYDDEFNKIWAAQAKHHPKLMTDERKKKIHHAIFTQRPLKPQKRGRCSYMNDETRTFRAMPSFQRYRIYQEVNNLEWRTAEGQHCLTDYPEARNAIIDLLEKVTTKNGQVVWGKMKNILKNQDLAEGSIEFNFETPKRKGFDGNLTSNIMQGEDFVGSDWHDWDLETQDKFIDVILDDELDDAEVKEHLMTEYSLNETAAETCTNAKLVEGTANISLKAARLMLEKMRDGIEMADKKTGEIKNILPIQFDAVSAVAEEVPEFEDPMRRKKTEEGDFNPEDEMPYYGKWFQNGSHIIPGTNKPEDEGNDYKYYGGVTNPTVHIALNQMRQVMNNLIDRYGHPHSIAIELGRDLPAGAEGRGEIEREQKKNKETNDRLDRILLGQEEEEEHGLDKALFKHKDNINRDDRLRLRLWEELDKDPHGRCCPFSGDKIGIGDLFNGTTEIDHLIPFSISLDDGRANKVICTRKANRDKGQRPPFEAFGHSPTGYDWNEIVERVKNLSKPKQWRFQEDALEIWKRDHAGFTERHLNDTRYIGRLAREYLESICHIDKIDVLTGRLTSLLRGHWGLNSILKELADEAEHPKDHNQPEGEQDKKSQKKNRDDHRHHAVDAIVIGMTNKSILQKVSTAANRAEGMKLESLFPKNKDGHSAIDPWDGFREKVKDTTRKIVVSHKAKKKKLVNGTTDGQLHNATALGLIKPIDEAKNKWETVIRRPIDYFKERKRVEAIRDEKLRAAFLQDFDDAEAVGKKGLEAVQQLAAEKGIRSLRCFGPTQAIPIRDKKGNIYKGYQGDNNWGIEIYAFCEGHKKADKWEGVVISRFDANKQGFQAGTTYRPHPAARLVMRLQINDCIKIEEKGKKRIMRLQKVGQDGQMCFAPLHEANVAARDSNKDDDFKYLNKRADPLQKLNPRKVHISPTGQVSCEKRRKPRRKNK